MPLLDIYFELVLKLNHYNYTVLKDRCNLFMVKYLNLYFIIKIYKILLFTFPSLSINPFWFRDISQAGHYVRIISILHRLQSHWILRLSTQFIFPNIQLS